MIFSHPLVATRDDRYPSGAMAKGHKAVKVDGFLGDVLAQYVRDRGVRQQHLVSVATFFYLHCPDEVRAVLDAGYAEWVKENSPPNAPCPVFQVPFGEDRWPPRTTSLRMKAPERNGDFQRAVHDAIDEAVRRERARLAEHQRSVKKRRHSRKSARKGSSKPSP